MMCGNVALNEKGKGPDSHTVYDIMYAADTLD
jgi:hypothetical protein